MAVSRLKPPERDDYWTPGDLSVVAADKLLRHPDTQIRTAAAIAEWLRPPGKSVRAGLLPAWRDAVCCMDGQQYELPEMFQYDRQAALSWGQEHLAASGHRRHHDDVPAVIALAQMLSQDEKLQLLQHMTPDSYDDDLFDAFVGDDAELYRRWLSTQPPERFRLRPLDREANARWEQRALAALATGVTPEEIADHCTPWHWGGMGAMSEHFTRMLPLYEGLANHSDHRLRPAGIRGLAWVKAQLDSAIQSERREAIYGR